MITVEVWTIMPGLKLPVPRRAEPITTIGNCSAIAGTNHERYALAASALTGSGLSKLMYMERELRHGHVKHDTDRHGEQHCLIQHQLRPVAVPPPRSVRR